MKNWLAGIALGLGLMLLAPVPSAQVTVNGVAPTLGIGGQRAYPLTTETISNTASLPTDPFGVLSLWVQANDTVFTLGGINLAYSTSLNNGWGIMQQDDGDMTFGVGATTLLMSPANDWFSFAALGAALEDYRLKPGSAANKTTIDSATGMNWVDNSAIDVTARHMGGNGSTPAVSDTSANSCGTGTQTITGTDMNGKVTVIGSAGTSCTVTFAVAYQSAPSCFASNETSGQLARATSTTSTVVLAGTFAQNDVIAYGCVGR